MVLDIERIYQEYRGYVKGTIMRMVGNPTIAEDLTTEVFLRIIEKQGSYKEMG